MNVAPNGEQVYHLSLSTLLRKKLHKLQRQAERQGRGAELAEAFERIVAKLKKSPRQHGDPLYPLPNLRLHVYQIAMSPIIVHYAVSDDHPIVYFKEVKLFSEKSS